MEGESENIGAKKLGPKLTKNSLPFREKQLTFYPLYC